MFEKDVHRLLSSTPSPRGPSQLVHRAITGKQPFMVHDAANADALLDVALEHPAHEVDAHFADDKWHAQVAVHDLVDVVEGILLVEDGVEQDAEGPEVLLAPVVRGAGQDFRRCVIW